MGSIKDLENMNLSGDESSVKKESSKPSQSAPLFVHGRADELLEVDLSSSSSNSNSHSHCESCASRASNAAEDLKNGSKTTSFSSPKNTVCSNKSDLTETSSLRISAAAKNEDQVESSLQGAQVTAPSRLRQPLDGEGKGDVAAQNNFAKKECSLQAIDLEDDDGSHASEEEVNICDICGDLGREKLLAVCSVCGVGAEHIYCMHVKLDQVPDTWICEDCVNAEKDGKQKEDVDEKEEPMNTTRRGLHCETSCSLDHERGLCSEDKERGSIRVAKVKAGSHLSSERCEKRSKTPSDDQIRSSRKRKAVKPQDCSVNKSVKTNTVSTRGSFPELRKRPTGCSAAGVSSNNGLSSTLDTFSITERIPVYKQSGNYGVHLLRDADPMMSYNPFNGTSRPGASTPQFHVFPVPYCIWQGKFKLQRNGVFSSFCGGIQAHLSRSASDNTSKLAPAFSWEILLEETPRSAVWATQFGSSRAPAENIHIYFFAKDPEGHESRYKSLLQHMVANDVCLRGIVGGFELLIFTSDKLEDGFQRWNGLSFLWGVFREPKPLSFSGSTASACQERNAEFNRAQSPQVPIEFRLVNLFQMATRTFEERKNLFCNLTRTNNRHHCESTAPNLELSLGGGGGVASSAASVSSGNIIDKGPSLLPVSSRNSHGMEPSLSLSLSLPQPFLGREALRVEAAMTGQGEDSERPHVVDTTLSLSSHFG